MSLAGFSIITRRNADGNATVRVTPGSAADEYVSSLPADGDQRATPITSESAFFGTNLAAGTANRWIISAAALRHLEDS